MDELLLSISATFAGIAAILWLWSSVVNLPIIGSAWGTLANINEFYRALKKIARLNAGAAICSFISAAVQMIILGKFFH